MKRIRDDFDGAWKNVLSEKRFASFMAFFMPDVAAEVDWTRPVEFLEQELRAITRKTKRGHRSVDKLAKVWLIDGTEKWVLVHIEIQSQEDTGFLYRMFQYYFRARDLFDGHSVVSIALLSDENANWRPNGYSDSFWGTEVDFRFRVVKLKDYADRLDELEIDHNPFARFVAAHLRTIETKNDYESRLEWKLRIVKALYTMGIPENEIGELYHDFDWLLTLPEALSRRFHIEMTHFEEELTMPHLSTAEKFGRRLGKKEGREEGRVEGRVEGQIEGVRESIMDILEARQFEISPELSADINTLIDLDSLRKLQKLLITNAPYSEFAAVLNAAKPN